MKQLLESIALILIAAAICATDAHAQQKPEITGSYAGMLGPLHITLQILPLPRAQSGLTGLLATPGAGDRAGIQCTDFERSGRALSFRVPALRATWHGIVADDGSLNGTWDQGRREALNFQRESRPRP
jgi:hypothetical protein